MNEETCNKCEHYGITAICINCEDGLYFEERGENDEDWKQRKKIADRMYYKRVK